MMISPSENGESAAARRGGGVGMPVRLLGEARRSVSRLEFHPLERVEVLPEFEQEDETKVFLKEEVAALGGRLRSQAEQISAEMELARSEARAETCREWEKELEERVAEERSSILKVCEEFRRERVSYFAGVEAEVVKLALAIAARVLHREAKLDPLLLTGVVRVALEKVAEDSTTVLRVPVSTVEMWREVFALRSESSPRIVGDERLSAGECVLETNVGRVELGVSAQLEEIERGFFDLMQQRPA
jgi:flagellar assembly protein FliH